MSHNIGEERYVCNICGRTHVGYGNNPAPLKFKDSDRCCDTCNYAYVIPARIQMDRLNRALTEEEVLTWLKIAKKLSH